jgi:hypothetical protein
MDKKSIGAGLMTLVYGLGIGALTFVAYFGAVLAFALVMIVLSFILGGNEAVAMVLVFLGIAGIVAGLYWFMFRFMVGLPGVALGHSPDFFKDMWPLAKGESWGVPLRMLLASLVAYVPMILILLVFGGTLFSDYINILTQQTANDNPAEVFPALADFMEGMAPLMVPMMLVFAPFMWFMTLLLAIAFQRFRARGE